MNEERRTARVVLINDHDQVLLVKFENSEPTDLLRPEILSYWVPPGGGVEPGESYEQAAKREIHEETGMSVEIGCCVWTRDLRLKLKGTMRSITERYFVAHCVGSTVDASRHAEDGIVSFRWWSLVDLTNSNEIIFPPGFAQLVDPLLRNEMPERTISIERI